MLRNLFDIIIGIFEIISVVIVMLLGVTATMAFWFGLVYFIFWCAQNFGVI